MTVGQIGAKAQPAAVVPRSRQPGRIRTATGGTPGRLTVNMILLAVVVLAFGLAAVIGADSRQSLIGSVRTGSGPLTLQAEVLYRSMSDADASAANAFLSAGLASGAEPPALRARYQQDIAQASTALVDASSGASNNAAALRQISDGLSVYTGLVETARADNRLGLPIGAAYLREASSLMRGSLLPAASALYTAQTTTLNGDRSDAAQFPWIAIPLGLIALVVAVRAQRALARRTHRVFNPGLLAATIAVVIALGWLTVSWWGVQTHLSSSNTNGSGQVQAFAQARIAVLRARADEALTLVARGNDPSFEKDFVASTKQTDELLKRTEAGRFQTVAAAADTDLAKWSTIHRTLRSKDDGGDYRSAVLLATGPDAKSAPAAFGAVDADLGRGIDQADNEFTTEAGDAASAASGAGIVTGILTALAAAGVVIGFRRRIAEYR